MPDKSPKEKDGLSELFNKVWLPFAGFIGAVTLAYNFYNMWSGDQATVTYFLAGGGLAVLVIALGWVAFSQKTVTRKIEKTINRGRKEISPRYARVYRWIAGIFLGTIIIGAAVGTRALIINHLERDKKMIVLIARFDGPDDKYRLHDEILKQLKMATKGYANTEIIPLDEVITETQGSQFARERGRDKGADIVLWGWYTETKNTNLNLYIENLSPAEMIIIQESENYQPAATLSDFESLKIQHQISSETTSLIIWLEGMLKLKSGDYRGALDSFESVPVDIENLTIMEPYELYYYMGYSYYKLGDDQSAASKLDAALKINPNYMIAHYFRGIFSSLSRENINYFRPPLI